MIKGQSYRSKNTLFFMSQRNFDPIIDDCFLDAGARVNARKYKNRINSRASQIISEHTPAKDSNSNNL